ncbi:ATP-binding protein [Streptomyces sp. KM273126]|uniref:ATP-binding protein n=1 Tax=Streptomyces sp. KM273126 TaxID=2545247 RepID=UPI0026C523BE|nr:ATP-binding protein [Streptomyces sp. KM273126]
MSEVYETSADLEVELLAFPKAVPELRRVVREHLGAPCGDVQLCVSELVGNVIRHVGEGAPLRLRVSREGGLTRVEVADPEQRAQPVLVHAAADDETGRGLALLDAVALRWGVEQGASGKTVWCELGEVGTVRSGSGLGNAAQPVSPETGPADVRNASAAAAPPPRRRGRSPSG